MKNNKTYITSLELQLEELQTKLATTEAALEEARTEEGVIAELRGEIKRLEIDHKRACALVAQMHRAAVGRIIGPKIGIVQDVQELRKKYLKALKEIRRLKS